MLQIHAKYTELTKDIFQNDSEFSSALDKACSIAINHRPSPKTPCRSPELVRIIFKYYLFTLSFILVYVCMYEIRVHSRFIKEFDSVSIILLVQELRYHA